MLSAVGDDLRTDDHLPASASSLIMQEGIVRLNFFFPLFLSVIQTWSTRSVQDKELSVSEDDEEYHSNHCLFPTMVISE